MTEDHSDSTVGEIISEMSAMFAFARTRWQRFATESAPDLKGIDVMLLNIVSRRGPITATELISALDMDKAAVSRRIARLRENGYVDAQPAAEDRRVMLLTATEPAQHLLDEIRGKWAQSYRERFATWEHDDLVRLREGLHRFNMSTGPAPPDGPAARCTREQAAQG